MVGPRVSEEVEKRMTLCLAATISMKPQWTMVWDFTTPDQ